MTTVFNTVYEYSTPFAAPIGMLAVGTIIYFRALTFTYGPAIIADLCIKGTIRMVGNATLGTILGTTVVAPAIVPYVMPTVAAFIGVVAGYFVMVILNIIAKRFFGIQPPPPNPA